MKKRPISEDIAKIVIISKAPDWAKMIVDAIPDLTYDNYLKNYKAIWNIALPASALLVIHRYVQSGLGKTFIVNMSAGIARAINDRAKNHINVLQELPEINFLGNKHAGLESIKEIKHLQIKDCLYLLNSSDLKLAMSRINSLPEDQKNNLLASFVPEDKDVRSYFEMFWEIEETLSKKTLNLNYSENLTKVDFLRLLLLDHTDESFRIWASINFDEKRKHN